jgi:hypothetical protein
MMPNRVLNEEVQHVRKPAEATSSEGVTGQQSTTYDIFSKWITQAILDNSKRGADMEVIYGSQTLCGNGKFVASYSTTEGTRCDLPPAILRFQW